MSRKPPHRGGRLIRGLLALPLILGGLGAVEAAAAAPAMAAGCEESKWYSISNAKAVHLPAANTHFKDGPGGTMSVSVTTSSTITASANVTAGATIGGIVATAKVEVNAGIAKAKAITVGHSYSHRVKAGKYGHLQYGSWGYTFKWAYRKQRLNCSIATLSSGTARTPTGAVGWRYWETSS